MQENSTDTISFRSAPDELALPIRRFGAFLPGEGVGGTGIHWGALHWRFLPTDFRIRSLLTERYGAKAIPDTKTIQDWPVSYDEIEQHYDRFEKLCGVSGQAGNLQGRLISGGNPFEGPRSGALSEQADQDRGRARNVRCCGCKPRLSPVSDAYGDLERALCEPGRRYAGRLQILRPLQSHRLRGQRKGLAEPEYRAGAAHRAEVRATHARIRHAA
jgi:choline dehydrogenase-like flavoprotein